MPDYKNSFRAPAYSEETIVDENGTLIGTIRLKPSSVLWKSKGAQKFHAARLVDFIVWIENNGNKVKQ